LKTELVTPPKKTKTTKKEKIKQPELKPAEKRLASMKRHEELMEATIQKLITKQSSKKKDDQLVLDKPVDKPKDSHYRYIQNSKSSVLILPPAMSVQDLFTY
jgi:hypothetical protein